CNDKAQPQTANSSDLAEMSGEGNICNQVPKCFPFVSTVIMRSCTYANNFVEDSRSRPNVPIRRRTELGQNRIKSPIGLGHTCTTTVIRQCSRVFGYQPTGGSVP